MINELYKNTTLYSDQGIEYIRIHTISFLYKKPFLFYNNSEIKASVYFLSKGIYVKFNDAKQLRNIIGIVHFYKLNYFYKFDTDVHILLQSTLLYSTKSIEDILIASNALITIYESNIINQTHDEINFRLRNNCGITIHFIQIEDGYLIELVHNQINLYKKEFKTFTSDYCNLLHMKQN